jgi:hypothetical protein
VVAGRPDLVCDHGELQTQAFSPPYPVMGTDRRSSARTTSPSTSPCVQTAIDAVVASRCSSTDGQYPPSASMGTVSSSTPTLAASGVTVSTQRRNGLDCTAVTRSCQRVASASACRCPFGVSGRCESSSPSQVLRLPAFAWRMRRIECPSAMGPIMRRG